MPIDKGHERPGRRIKPLNIEIPCRREPEVLFTMLFNILIDLRTISVLEGNGLTGYYLKAAKGRRKHTGEDVHIKQLGVQGWGGVIASDSGVREVSRCSGCHLIEYSPLTNPDALINLEAWDESDFFMICPLPKYVFVSQRVVDVFQQQNITGVRFTKDFPRTSWGPFTPGRLSYWMPEERAREIGEPLGIH